MISRPSHSPLSLRERVRVRVRSLDRQQLVIANTPLDSGPVSWYGVTFLRRNDEVMQRSLILTRFDTRSAHGDNREDFIWGARGWQRVRT